MTGSWLHRICGLLLTGAVAGLLGINATTATAVADEAAPGTPLSAPVQPQARELAGTADQPQAARDPATAA